MVLPPDSPDGLGVILLNSVPRRILVYQCARSSSPRQMRKRWPPSGIPGSSLDCRAPSPSRGVSNPAKAFSERVGTALINGSWFVRQLRPLGDRIVALHGHRHVDWIGECSGVRSSRLPLRSMEATNDEPSYFHILTLAAGKGGRLCLLAPERVDLPGDPDPA